MVIYKRIAKSERCPKHSMMVELDEELAFGDEFEPGKNVYVEGRTLYSDVKGVVKQWHNTVYVIGIDDPPEFNVTDQVIGVVKEWMNDNHEPGWNVDIGSKRNTFMPARRFRRLLHEQDGSEIFAKSPIILGEITYRNPMYLEVECITPGFAHLEGTIMELTNFEYIRACIIEGTKKLSKKNNAPILLAKNHRLLNCGGKLSEENLRLILKEPATVYQ